jgi:hypothetical protein
MGVSSCSRAIARVDSFREGMTNLQAVLIFDLEGRAATSFEKPDQ